MVISRVVSSLIINFSPWLVCLPGAVRSVCVSAASSAGSKHYTCCCGVFLWNCDAERVWSENRTLCRSHYIAVRGAVCCVSLGVAWAPVYSLSHHSWDTTDVLSVSVRRFHLPLCWELSWVTNFLFSFTDIGLSVQLYPWLYASGCLKKTNMKKYKEKQL